MDVDPQSLAIVTSAVTQFFSEFSKGLVGEIAKETYSKIKEILLWNSDPPANEVPARTAQALVASPEKIEEIVQLLGEAAGVGISGQIVTYARNIGAITNYGTQTNTFN